MEEWIILNGFNDGSRNLTTVFMLLFLFHLFNCYVFTFFPINFASLVRKKMKSYKYSSHSICCEHINHTVKTRLTLHFTISGPSKLNGSVGSGEHFISYSFVKTELEKYSFGEKWNSNTNPCNKKQSNRISWWNAAYYAYFINIFLRLTVWK